jgi:hypothetical protein
MSDLNDELESNFKAALESTKKLVNKAKDNQAKLSSSANHNIAKNRIAIFVIRTFCLTLVAFVIMILYGSLFSGSQNWKDAIPPIMDIMQKIFLPIVTLAFGFYNSNKGD